MGTALLPRPHINADYVLSEMHPVSDSEGFAAETYPFRIEDEVKRRLVLNTLGAGATVPGTVRRENDNGRYFVSATFYSTLLDLRAGKIPAFRPNVLNARFGISEPRQAGTLSSHDAPRALASSDVPRRIEGRTARDEAPPPPPSRGETIDPTPAPQDAAFADPPRQRKPASSKLASDIRKKVIAGALQRWGSWGDDEIEAIWHTRPEPVAAALRGLVERRGPIGMGVQQLAFEIEQNIADTYRQLQRNGVGDIQVLESEVDNVRRMLPVLIMTADGPYHQMIDEMIRELKERGAALEDQAGSSRLSDREIGRFHMLDDHFRKFMALDGTFNRDEELIKLMGELPEIEQAHFGASRGDNGPMS
jgi:hypothetical protein